MLRKVLGKRLRLSNMAVFARASQAAAVAVAIFSLAGSAWAQDRSPNFLDNLFGNNNAPPPAARGGAQVDDADLTVQINQLQGQVRQLTGTIEQLQYRNQQLEQQVRALQGNSAAGPGPGAIASPAYPATQQQPRGMQQPPAQQNYPSAVQQNYPAPVQQHYPSADQQSYPPPVITAAPGRRSDVFDPNENPNAPGAPRVLGSPATVAPPDYPAA